MFCQVLVRLYQNFIRFIQDLSWVLQDLQGGEACSVTVNITPFLIPSKTSK